MTWQGETVTETAQHRLLDRLVVTDGILHDQVSGVKRVLNASARFFFEVFQNRGSGPAAIEAIVDRYGITPERARQDFEAFLDTIDQKQQCVGSILPGSEHAVIEPTAACNGQCPHCYHGTRSDRWPAEQVDTILAKVAAGGVRSVSITGGEVFSAHFADHFFDLVKTLRDHGVSVASVSTNATFLTEDIRDRALETLDETTVFRISLDALRSDLLDRVRPGYRSLPDPYAPIRELDTAGRKLVFTTNLWSQPVEDVLEIGEYLRGYRNVGAWNVRLAVPVHHGVGERARTSARRRQLFGLRPDPRLPLRYFAALLTRHAQGAFPFPVRMGNYLMTSHLAHPRALSAHPQGHPCREDARLVTVKADGAITQCPILTELAPSMNSGQILDFSGDDLFTDLPLAGLNTASMPCADCALRPVCGGGCRLYPMAYERGAEGCDEPARALVAWLLTDPTGLLRTHWPDYHERLHQLIPDRVEAERMYADHAAGWDR